jgi:hypothetical protein
VANNKITTQDLDFDGIKSNLKTFFQGQTELSDYNFEGSGLALLLDVLAYNTHYNALYTNLAVNEAFLDSAVKRNSVVSKAFELGYLPKSATSAKSTVNITVSGVTGSPGLYSLSANTPFTTNVNGTTYTFYNLAPAVAQNNGGTYKFSNVVLTEGIPLTQSYIVSDTTSYIISNQNCDISTLTVDVYDNPNSSVKTKFSQVDDIISVQVDEPVYFIKEIEGGKYEIQFGNGRIGRAVSNGNMIVMNYMVSNRANANGARVFNTTGLGSSTNIVTLTTSSGGGDAETIEDIKFNAPRLYNANNRAVTSEDYRSLLIAKFPNIDSINVWGGDDNIPPVYGKVFISILPKYNGVLTTAEKDIIKNDILKSRKTVTIVPEFVEPFYLNIKLNTTVYYNSDTTSKSAYDISVAATNAILDYNNTNLKKFDSIFRYSKLMAAIDGADIAINSNISTLVIDRTLPVKFNVTTNYLFHIDNPVYSSGVPEDAVTSNGFYVFGDNTNIQYLKDDGYGIIQRYYIDPITLLPVFTNTNQGTINYSTGSLSLTALHVTRFASTELIISFKMQSNDILSVRDHIVRIEPASLTVTSIPESGSSGLTHTFTASR